MPLYKGSSKIGNFYFGSTKIKELYYGSTLVYTSAPASEDYEYTVQVDNSAILTKYIGTNPVVVGPDYVKGDL